LLCAQAVQAVTTVFFNPAQAATLVATNATSDTASSGGYLFTYSLDKWWYPTINLGPGTPTGRFTNLADSGRQLSPAIIAGSGVW